MESSSFQTPRRTRNLPGRSLLRFAFTKGDVDILRLIHQHRFLRRDQLSLLVGRHAKRLHRRVRKLETRGYIRSLRYPQQKFLYDLRRPGIVALVEEGFAPAELLTQRRRTHELTELFLRHEMMIVDIHVRLTLALRTGPGRLIAWREGRTLHDTVVSTDYRRSERLPMRPDAFFTLLDSRRPESASKVNYMLEADRSTTTQTRFEQKIRAYSAYIEQGLHERKFAIKNFKVLTVTLSDIRARNLAALAQRILPEWARKHFFFLSFNKLLTSAEPVSESLCFSARTGGAELHALLPGE